jgi:hypothetical protein
MAHVIKHVMTSATEAELAAVYIMAPEAVYIRIILEEMGHQQLPIPLQTDNPMADAVCNGKILEYSGGQFLHQESSKISFYDGITFKGLQIRYTMELCTKVIETLKRNSHTCFQTLK